MGLSRRRTEMASKKHKPEEAVAKLRQVDVLVSQGQSVAEAIRAIGVTEVTYYRWRREFGGLKGDQVRRLKALEAENARLRKAVADLTLDKQILAEAAPGKGFSSVDAPRGRKDNLRGGAGAAGCSWVRTSVRPTWGLLRQAGSAALACACIPRWPGVAQGGAPVVAGLPANLTSGGT